jgi:hypothetical protein
MNVTKERNVISKDNNFAMQKIAAEEQGFTMEETKADDGGKEVMDEKKVPD